MRLQTSAVLISGLAATSLAATVAHGHSHKSAMGKRHNHAERHADIMANQVKRDLDRRAASNLLTAADSAKLLSLGFQTTGLNPTTSGATPWVGAGGQFANTFHNVAADNVILTIWGPAGSWVNAVQPQITVSIPAGGNQTISFPTGWSGAWSTIHSTSTLVNGQIFDTWGEGTFAPPYSVVDVSREVNMNGRSMTIVGPTCTSDMNTCSFQCYGGTSCYTSYQLVNCATGSQAGANYGMFEGMPSGGCGGMGNGAHLNTYLG